LAGVRRPAATSYLRTPLALRFCCCLFFSLQRGIDVINRIETPKFGRILTRIIGKLHLKVRNLASPAAAQGFAHSLPPHAAAAATPLG